MLQHTTAVPSKLTRAKGGEKKKALQFKKIHECNNLPETIPLTCWLPLAVAPRHGIGVCLSPAPARSPLSPVSEVGTALPPPVHARQAAALKTAGAARAHGEMAGNGFLHARSVATREAA